MEERDESGRPVIGTREARDKCRPRWGILRVAEAWTELKSEHSKAAQGKRSDSWDGEQERLGADEAAEAAGSLL